MGIIRSSTTNEVVCISCKQYVRMASSNHATSSIPHMTVAEVRRALSEMRQRAAVACPESPLWIVDRLSNGMMIAEFAQKFVYGHHLKRHNKSAVKSTVAKEAIEGPVSQTELIGLPGPKGDVSDPFPFTPGWKPTTEEGRKAFAGTPWVEIPSLESINVEKDEGSESDPEAEAPPEQEPRRRRTRQRRGGTLTDLLQTTSSTRVLRFRHR